MILLSMYGKERTAALLRTVERPIVSQVLEASKERPCLRLCLMLDPTLVSPVMVEDGHPPYGVNTSRS